MSRAIITESKLTAIADAIRAKTGGTEELTVDEMASEISTIGGLPSAYQRVEYIEQGDGGHAYINTNYYIKATDNIYVKLYLPLSKFVAWANIFGAIDSSQTFPNNCIKACQMTYSGVSPKIGLNRGGNGYEGNSSSLFDKEIAIRLFPNQAYAYFYYAWTIVTVGNSSARNIQDCVNRCILFSSSDTKIRMYYFQAIGENGEINCNLVPCYRKSDNVIGMYDLVTDTFYTNAGTGTFTKGADV